MTRPGRLVFRIYAVSLAQLFAVWGAVMLVGWINVSSMPRPDFLKYARTVAGGIAPHLRNPAQLKREADRAHSELRALVTVYGPDDRVMISNMTPPLQALSPEERTGLQRTGWFSDAGPPPRISVALDHYGFPGAYLVYMPRFPGPPVRLMMWFLAIALFATAVASVLLARSFAQPLATLAAAARKLGAGDLTARTHLRRRDEFGQLAESFDEMAEHVAQLVRSQQELLANVSHELRTPLARIRVALDLAAEGDAETGREALSEIAEDLHELERLVGDVLQNARLDLAAGRAGSQPPLRPETVDPAALLEKAAARFRSSYPERRLELRLAGEFSVLTADGAMLRRAIDNVLDNARKYSDTERPIGIEAHQSQGALEICIEDRGIGIPANDLASVATPFFRTDRSRARRSGGLGLGLSLARRIVEAHGGSMVVESQLGVGTKIRVSIPVQDSLPAVHERSATSPPPHSPQP